MRRYASAVVLAVSAYAAEPSYFKDVRPLLQRQCQERLDTRTQNPISGHERSLDLRFRPEDARGIIDTPMRTHQ